jgi:hypothetical protein
MRDENTPPVTTAAAAVLASALMIGLGAWSDRLGALMWVATIPVLAVALRASVLRAATYAFFAAALGGTGLAFVYRGTALPTAALLGAAALGGVTFAIVIAIARAIDVGMARGFGRRWSGDG